MCTSVSLLPRIVLCLAPAAASHAAADSSTPPVPIPAEGSVILNAETGQLHPGRAVIVEQASFGSKRGVSLKDGAAANVGTATAEPDLVFRVQAAEPGRYVVRTHAATDAKGTEAMRLASSKHDSIYLMLAVGKGRPTRRVVFVPWRPAESCRQTLGTFALDAGEQAIRIWLPEGVRLDYVQLSPYVPPKVPPEAATYQPPVRPPASHPRVWVNEQSLANVRQNLTKGENAPLWAQVQRQANEPSEFHVEPGAEVGYDARLERAAVDKAFVYLMTGDEARGREAVTLVRDYLTAVEFGNLLEHNFCKRSVSHSMMLAVDPDETFRGTTSNDGGTRFVRSCPRTPEQATSDPTFANGTILSADFGPSGQRPFYSYFSVDLTSAYSKKIANYVRTFCFLNLDNPRNPAVLIVLDNMTTAQPEFTKYWQVNTLEPPEATSDGVTLTNQAFGLTGKVDVRMFRPAPADRNMQILSGKDAYSVFGQYFTPPKPDRPEANGHRVMFTPKEARENDLFLTVLSMREEQAASLPVDVAELPDAFVLTLADRFVVLSKTGNLLDRPIDVTVRAEGKTQLLLASLAPGPWHLSGSEGNLALNVQVEPKRNTALFVVTAGSYTMQPGVLPGAPEFQPPPEFMPAPSEAIEAE